ncbi:hypothetical protein NWO25_01940 [Enterococcus lactis]|nr:hypothetical protein [Enterococcus lactis]
MEDLYLANQVCFPLYAASKEIIRHYTPLQTAGSYLYPVSCDASFMGKEKDYSERARK